MSAVDPLAGAAAAVPDADLAALIDTELAQLAADAQALRGLLVEDAVVTARVLPSNGLTDLLEIAGRRVPASLPLTVRPGDVLQVQVTGFDGDRILLQIVGTGADAAVETPALPQIAPSAAAFVAASILPAAGTPSTPDGGYAPPGTPDGTDAPAPGTAPGSPAPGGVGGAGQGANAAGPGAAGQGGAGAGAGGQGGAGAAGGVEIPLAVPSVRPGVGTAFTSVVSRATVAPSQAGAGQAGMPPRAPVTGPGEPTSIEARLAAARASIAQRTAGFGSDAGSGSSAPGQRFVAPPQIAERTALPNADGGVRGGLPGAYRNASAPGAGSAFAASSSAPAAGARASALAAYAEPVALLRALRLPVTPSNVASAALALQRPEHLPDALAALERALPRASDDPNVATLRTLLSFVGRIDPRSPALAAQIAAFVDHAVDGAEPKLATLLAASQAAAAPADGDTASTGAASADGGAASPAGTGAASSAADASAAGAAQQRALTMPSLSAALAAERGAALGADLKQTLLAVAANPATPEALAPSLAGALTALTAVQVSAAQTLAANPDGLAFTIPLSTPSGTANAHVSVKRDAPDGRGGARVDPDNFRIAFVLDTAHYGTVAIDLVTVGRDVTVDVRTEAAPSMRAFRDALGTLTARLESLRYRVASAGASVGTTSTVAVEAPPARPYDPDATVDRSA